VSQLAIDLEEINQDLIILTWAIMHFSSIQQIADQHDNKHNKKNLGQGAVTGLHNKTPSSQVGLQNQATSTGRVSTAAVGIQSPTNTAASVAQVSLMNSNTGHNVQMGSTGASTMNSSHANANNLSTQGHGAGQQVPGHGNYNQNPLLVA